MAKTILVEVITPERLALSEEADFLAAPAYEGEVGILPGHAPMLCQLQPGALRLISGESARLFAISGGFMEVRPHKVEVFAETAEQAEEIDLERARQQAEKAKAAMLAPTAEVDLLKVQAALRTALARMKLAEGIRRKK